MTNQLSLAESEDLMAEFIRSKCRALAEKRGWPLRNIEIDFTKHSINLVGDNITPEEAMAFYNELIDTCKGILC